MIIPYQSLPQETLRALIEDFITREGTDYGEEEINLQVKVDQVQQLLLRGDVSIVFDAASESTSIVSSGSAKESL